MVSNAHEYLNEEALKHERPERPEGEDFKIKSADISEAIKRGHAAAVIANPTRVNGRSKFADLIRLSAKDVINPHEQNDSKNELIWM
jgi:hypothetical protein